MADYRQRVYEKYASCFQNTQEKFNPPAADRWGRGYDWYLRGWLPKQKNAAILEVACGAGRLLHFFKKRGYTNLTGVDVSPEQICLAKQVKEKVIEADVLEFLNATTKTYDLVIGLDIIEHFYKDEVLRLWDGCYRVLRPGGRLILQTPNADSPYAGAIRYGDFTHEICFQPNSLSTLLKLCGFTEIEVREQGPVPWGYSLKSTLRWLMWQLIRLGLKTYNLAETGTAGSGVLTRVFLTRAIKGK